MNPLFDVITINIRNVKPLNEDEEEEYWDAIINMHDDILDFVKGLLEEQDLAGVLTVDVERL